MATGLLCPTLSLAYAIRVSRSSTEEEGVLLDTPRGKALRLSGHSAPSDCRGVMAGSSAMFPSLPTLWSPVRKLEPQTGNGREAGKGRASLLPHLVLSLFTVYHSPDSSCQQRLSNGASDQCQHFRADPAQRLHRQRG